VIVLELTRHLDQLMVPTVIAVVEATVISRRLKAHSIYSARLKSGEAMAASPTANAASIATIFALDETLPPDFSERPGAGG
jgi:H+/Cl- antiporter ClcA